MSIEVRCPHGHVFKVKDKYAGKRGLCPMCQQRVVVTVPQKLSDDEIAELIGAPPREEVVEEEASAIEGSSESVLDTTPAETSGVSLIGASAIRHSQKCPNCSEQIPYWYAKCPRCQTYLPGAAAR